MVFRVVVLRCGNNANSLWLLCFTLLTTPLLLRLSRAFHSLGSGLSAQFWWVTSIFFLSSLRFHSLLMLTWDGVFYPVRLLCVQGLSLYRFVSVVFFFCRSFLIKISCSCVGFTAIHWGHSGFTCFCWWLKGLLVFRLRVFFEFRVVPISLVSATCFSAGFSLEKCCFCCWFHCVISRTSPLLPISQVNRSL